jgi:hypothetical protein
MDAMAQVSEPKVKAIPDLDSGVSLTVDVMLPAHQPCAVTLRLNTRTLNPKPSGCDSSGERIGSGSGLAVELGSLVVLV